MFSGKYRKIFAPRETAREGPQASPSLGANILRYFPENMKYYYSTNFLKDGDR